MFFSFLDRYASLLITVGSSMVLARLLTPAEIGVFSVTMVLLIFVNTVRDLNAGQYLVQEKNLTVDHIRSVWALQLGLGLGLALLVLLAAYPVAWFYKEPRMRDIMIVVAFNYAVNPFGSLTNAWLVREMRFQSLAVMRFISSLIGAAISIGLAWQGWGPISLALGSLATTLVNAVLATFYRPRSFPWLPGTTHIRSILGFGSKVTGSSFISNLASNSPELLLGKLQDLTAVGHFSRANGLVQMFYRLFSDAVGTVCMPWFAKQSREGGSLSDPFLKATSYMTVLGWPFCVGLACLAYPVTELLYGDQWRDSVGMTRILALATAFSVPAVLCRTALLSSGHVDRVMRVTVQSAVPTTLLVLAGAHFGLIYVGWALVLAAILSTGLWLQAVHALLEFRLHALMSSSWVSLKVSALTAIGPFAVYAYFGEAPAHILPPLVLGISTGIVGFLGGVVCFKHPLREELGAALARRQ
ncbi:lipopolysaccharide biosynthesis protein [Roseateles koreensis]|uniref:Lipopolysaccharide biosynthesis protein n=1 Tax=Roseateles koreensis TaxID=2987526 RepID=A0ABT5KTB1_9BURK|nr:lipopolysaccharide biosynthesis protein [Roseateles koreensis]MDC8786164.1 lipopolysaccharide biosynthesis protein [Roseateles koreensis]